MVRLRSAMDIADPTALPQARSGVGRQFRFHPKIWACGAQRPDGADTGGKPPPLTGIGTVADIGQILGDLQPDRCPVRR